MRKIASKSEIQSDVRAAHRLTFVSIARVRGVSDSGIVAFGFSLPLCFVFSAPGGRAPRLGALPASRYDRDLAVASAAARLREGV